MGRRGIIAPRCRCDVYQCISEEREQVSLIGREIKDPQMIQATSEALEELRKDER